jgi:hypothetical protein
MLVLLIASEVFAAGVTVPLVPSGDTSTEGVVAGVDTGTSEGVDTGVDTGTSEGVDTGTSEGVVVGVTVPLVPSGDTSTEGVYTGTSEGVDTGTSEGVDTGVDTGTSEGVVVGVTVPLVPSGDTSTEGVVAGVDTGVVVDGTISGACMFVGLILRPVASVSGPAGPVSVGIDIGTSLGLGIRFNIASFACELLIYPLAKAFKIPAEVERSIVGVVAGVTVPLVPSGDTSTEGVYTGTSEGVDTGVDTGTSEGVVVGVTVPLVPSGDTLTTGVGEVVDVLLGSVTVNGPGVTTPVPAGGIGVSKVVGSGV